MLLLLAAWGGGLAAKVVVLGIVAWIGLVVLGGFIPMTPSEIKDWFRSASLDWSIAGLVIAMTVVGAFKVLGMILWLVNDVAIYAKSRGHVVDQDMLLTAILTLIAAIICGGARVIVIHQVRLRGDSQASTSTDFLNEAVWALVLIIVALMPAVFPGSWVPSVICAVLIPLVVTHARGDFARFRVEAITSEDEGEG